MSPKVSIYCFARKGFACSNEKKSLYLLMSALYDSFDTGMVPKSFFE